MDIREVNKLQIQTMRENLKWLRGQKSWSIRELSRRSGVKPGVLRRIEDGRNFNLRSLLILCGVYGVRPRDIFYPIRRE